MKETVCRICKRPLKNLESILAGVGPVCAGGGHIPRGRKPKDKQAELTFGSHAAFVIKKETDCFVYIEDRGNHHNCKTVTNDAEWILKELADSIANFENKRLLYMDSEGRIDEIEHSGRRFIGFKAGHEGVAI
jgi:hypothetical protein